MNKIFYQFRDTDDGDEYTFMYLNPIESDNDTHERVDLNNPPGEATSYTESELESSFEEQISNFKLEIIYD